MANFLSTIASMFRTNRSARYNVTRPTRKKKETYKPYTREEIAKIQVISRLPASMQQQAYKSDKALSKRVAVLTPKGLEARPFVSSVMNRTGQDLIKKLETATGKDIDTKKVEQSALWKAGTVAGEVANFALTGGAAGGAVASLVTKGAKLGKLAQLGANVAGDVVASTPYNLTQAASTAVGTKNPEKEFAKNFAINTAMDIGIGGAIGVVPLVAKALKKVPETKEVGVALEKGGAIKDATEAEVKVQQAVKNLTQRKLKTGTTVTPPTPTAQMVQPQTPQVTPQVKPLHYISKQIKSSYNSKINSKELSSDITKLYSLLNSGNVDDLDIAAEEVYSLAKKVVSNSSDSSNPVVADYNALKNYMKKTPLKVLDEHRGDFGKGEWNRFRKSNFGKLNLSNDGQTMDSIYMELVDLFPSLLSKEMLDAAPSDQLKYVIDVMDSLKNSSKNIDINSSEGSELVDMVAMDILNSVGSVKAIQPQKIQPPLQTPQAPISPVTQPKAPTTPIAKKAKPLPNATILSKAPTEKKVSLIKAAIEDFRLRAVDTFTPQEDFARQVRRTNYEEGTRLLAKINKARNSKEIARNFITNAQVDATGTKEVGESLTAIMDRVPQDKSDLFQEYIFTKHHIDRLAKGKPILNLTKSQSIKRLQDINNSLTPAEKKLFNDTNLAMRKYIDNLRQYGIDTGLITQKQIDLFEQMYPNYIKTARDRGVNLVNTSTSNPAVKTIIKNASRSDLPILPLRSQLEILTNDFVVTGNYNDMIREIAQAKGIKGAGTKQALGNTLTATNQLGTSGDTNFIKFFDSGKEYKLPISNLEAKSYKLLMQGGLGKEGASRAIGDVLTPINTWFKLPITGVNPIFMVKNFFRDFEDALFYTQDIKGFLKNYPSAYKELADKGDFYKLYQASGGKYSTFSYLDKDLKDKRTWFTRNISQRIEDANSYIEQIPRMTEFMNVLKKELNGKDISQATGDMVNKASLAASEITTNFGRSGDVGKYLNRTAVPFLNPSIQGGSRIIRQLMGQDGFKGYMRLASKALLLGMVPAVVNEMIYGDDPEYQQFNDRDKEISFIFKVGDTWIKIPKGRLLAVMGMIPQGVVGQLKGDEYDFAELFSVAGGQIGPVNPLQSNLFTPLIQAATNKTWYGGEIDNQQWDDVKKSDRYDSTTSAIGKFLGSLGISAFGDKINLSPRQWDYVIDGYTGIFGDTILPLTREDKTRRNPIKQAFTLDPTFQNDLSANFYKLYDKVTVLPKEPTQIEQLSKRFMDRYKAKANEVLSQIREAQEEQGVPDEVKEAEIRELREELNNIYKNAEFELAEFQNFVATSIAKYGDEEKGYQGATIQSQIETGTDEWTAYTMFMEGGKKDNYEVAKKAGIDAKTYYELFDGRLDADKSGGISQEEAQSVLDSTEFTNEQKSVLWGLINKGWKTNPYTGSTASGGSTGDSRRSAKSVASAYRQGLATKQVNALENLTIASPNLTSAEIKAIIKMLSA